MKQKERARYEMGVIIAERESLMEQGLSPAHGPSLQEVWSRLPALVAGAQQAEQLLAMVKRSPEFADHLFAMMDAQEQQQARAA